jgi:hypothetical protein
MIFTGDNHKIGRSLTPGLHGAEAVVYKKVALNTLMFTTGVQ